MRKTIAEILSCAIVTMFLISILVPITMAKPQIASMEIINPADGTHEFSYTTSQKSVGDDFLINVTVKDVVNLFSWQIKVSWDPTLLDFVNISMPVGHVFQGRNFFEVGPALETGAVIYGAVLANLAQSTFNGTGTLAQLYLKIIQGVLPGETVECNLDFVNPSPAMPADTFMQDRSGADITSGYVGGHYSYTAPWIPPPPAKLYINPPRVVDPALIAGTKFNVSLNIINGTGVHYWSAKIVFDEAILNAFAVFEGDFLSSAGSTTFMSEVGDFNATHGVLDMNCTLADQLAASGNGVLATVVFEVMGLGASDILIFEADLRNPTNLPLPFTLAHGYFNNQLIAKLSIQPPEVQGPEYVPGATFTINVTLDDVENLKVCIFNLTYDPLVIQEININVPSVLGQTPVKKLVVDDDNGYIWANLTYRNGVTTYEPVNLMTVEFMVVAMGVSPINLTGVALYDLNDQPIVPEVSHGIFIGLIRDVAVINVEPSTNVAYPLPLWEVDIKVTVKNKGNLTETFDVKFYYDTTLGGTTTVHDLAPDEERNVTIVWSTIGVQPCHNYTISATAGPVPYEMNLGDNSFEDGKVKIRIIGDVNGDGVVDTKDVTAAVIAFRTYPGRLGWDPLCDLVRDNLIDIRDIVTIVLHFQERCPE